MDSNKPEIPVVCGENFTNNTENHEGAPHVCGKEYHSAVEMHRCRECGAKGY
jgi:hypothetical protein